MESKNQVREEKIRLKFVTILAIFLLLLSLVSLGVALLKPDQPEISSVQGKVTVNVIGTTANVIAEPSAMAGKIIVNVVPTN